ncbi:MAG: glycosyltransferase family 4 protein [Thermoanaerobaculales bacterium]
MRILFLSDRLSERGGADQHLLQVMRWAAEAGHSVTLACGRIDERVGLDSGIEVVRVRGLATAVASAARLGRLSPLLGACDVVHVQNVMNPVALEMAASTGRSVVTVQDHRVFCPAAGKTLPDGSRCTEGPANDICSLCLPEGSYRRRTLDLTRARLEALHGSRLVVLSQWMADELAVVGHPGAEIIPPWVEIGAEGAPAGSHLLLGGRLVHHKGVIDALKAWREAGVSLELRVAGEGPLESQLEDVKHLGWLSQSVLRRELRAARALLFPAFWQEPFGILGVQALAEGTPVIVAESGGAGEWSDVGCVRAPAGDIGAMAEAIVRIAGDPDDARRIGEAGRRMVAGRFGKRPIERRLRTLYSSIA